MSDSSSLGTDILIVDDDPMVQRDITCFFGENHLAVASVSGRQEMARQVGAVDPRLVILDLHSGQNDGFELLREIRSRSNVPVIITTRRRLEEIDRVIGLELGADDCVPKPLLLRELLARVRAVLRRTETRRRAPSRDRGKRGYRFGGWRLELLRRRLLDPTGIPIALTKNEYTLLLAFLNAPQQTLSREQLLHATRLHEDIHDRSIDVQVLRLRRKLRTDPAAPPVIQTERGVGYVFAQLVEAL